jgi:hypothetical protein
MLETFTRDPRSAAALRADPTVGRYRVEALPTTVIVICDGYIAE